jgi:hypothetical protein
MHGSPVCANAGVDKSTALPVIEKHSISNYVQYIILNNHNRQLILVDTLTTLYFLLLFFSLLSLVHKKS